MASQLIVTPSGTVDGAIAIRDGRIAGVSAGARVSHVDRLDLGRRWLVPGFIDMHVHGGGGAQCNTADAEEIAAVACFHAQHGTTALLATTVAAPVADLTRALAAIATCAGSDTGPAATVIGAHLEGPFLSPARPGAMDPAMFTAPDAQITGRLLAAGNGTVAMMTIAPELPGALELVKSLVEEDVIPSLGHSDATYGEACEAIRKGAHAATHLFNAMRPFHHREPGVVGAVLDRPEVSCELICDGVHIDPAALRVAYRAKGNAGVRLVTDAIEAAGKSDGQYRLGAVTVDVRDGVATVAGGESIAGSTLTMDVAVRNAVRFLDISVVDAVALAGANPARLLGLDDRKGSIAAGMDADLVVLDESLSCVGTMVGGAWVFGPPTS